MNQRMMRIPTYIRWLMNAVALPMLMGYPALAANGSPLDAYYNQQSVKEGPKQAAPVDNDQYYIAPGQYIDSHKYYAAPVSSSVSPTSPRGINCNTIGDAPSCISD